MQTFSHVVQQQWLHCCHHYNTILYSIVAVLYMWPSLKVPASCIMAGKASNMRMVYFQFCFI